MFGSDQSTDELERTAFRIADKKYKLYYDTNAQDSKSTSLTKLIVKKKVPREMDPSDVLDFKSVLERYDRTAEVPDGAYAKEFDDGCLAFCLETGVFQGFISFLELLVMTNAAAGIK